MEIVIIIAIFAVGSIAIVGLLLRTGKVCVENAKRSGELAEKEKHKKREFLEDLAYLSLGLTEKTAIEQGKVEKQKAEEQIKTERGRLAITRAEIQAVEARLCELEELETELENSAFEAGQELERLRSAERAQRNENAELNHELDSSLDMIDKLLVELAHSREVVDALAAAKSEILETQRQIEFFEVDIEELNNRYIDLKRAYDALDIEYAQLYEKQSSS